MAGHKFCKLMTYMKLSHFDKKRLKDSLTKIWITDKIESSSINIPFGKKANYDHIKTHENSRSLKSEFHSRFKNFRESKIMLFNFIK